MKTRIRFIATASTRETAETMAAGCKKVRGCVHTVVCALTDGTFQVRSYWRHSAALTKQDGAVVVEI